MRRIGALAPADRDVDGVVEMTLDATSRFAEPLTAERLFGSLTFGLLFLMLGLGGSILSLAWTLRAHPTLPSVGASGAVFGVMGGLIGFALARRRSVPPDVRKALLRGGLWFAAINIGLGLALPMVDNGAHIGGLLVGLGLGAAWSRELPPAAQPSWRKRMMVLVIGVVLLTLGFWWTAAAAITRR